MTPMGWSAQRQTELIDQLTGFWAQDEWDMKECPLLETATVRYRIRFTCRFNPINQELKYAVWQKFERGEWNPQYRKRVPQLKVLMDWLNTSAVCTQSLVEQDLAKLLLSCRTYLTTKGIGAERITKRLDGSQTIQTYHMDDPTLSVLRQLYRVIEDAYDPREEYEKPVWDVRKLGLSVNGSRSDYTLNFTCLAPDWLYTAGKRFIYYSLATNSVSECQSRLLALSWFGRFLVSRQRTILPQEIDRTLILEYLGYLRVSSLSNRSRKMHLIQLRTFLDLAAREGWAPVLPQRLIYSEDIPRPVEPAPRDIPEDIVQQLNRHLDDLPSEIQRMVLILQECGMRISELCALPRDCLIHDTSGDAFLRYYQGKMKKEHAIPVTSEVAAVIRAQQQTVETSWGDRTPYLFPRRNGEPFKQRTFVDALNKLAYRHQIKNTAGALFRFQSHQFRHTVGTRMINNGVPQHIIQRFLGHESPEMTNRYAHLHDQTLKTAFAEFHGKMVDVNGKICEPQAEVNSTDLQWLKHNILAQALPNGYCALPVLASPCPHANACLTCAHFRTDGQFLPPHRQQLAETERLLDIAETHQWARQIEVNRRVKTNLEQMIAALEQEETHAPT